MIWIFRTGVLVMLLASSVRAATEVEALRWNVQVRARGELRENVYDFDASQKAVTDDSWLLHRLRVGLEWEPVAWLKVTVQGQDTRESFSDRPDVPLLNGAEGDDFFDLRLASVEVGLPEVVSVKVGRQVLAYGDERLVGPLEWLNFSRTFDAVKVRHEGSDWWVEAFASSVVRLDRSGFNRSDWLGGDDSQGQIFSGLYFSSKQVSFQTSDVYAFHLHEDGGTDFLTGGVRMKGDPLKLAGWDYTIEWAGQTGEVKGRDLRAFAHHLEGGYNWLHAGWKPRLALEYSYGSGDRDAGDGKTGTFQNLFPTNHPPYGLMDVFSWQNQHNAVLRLAAQPHEKVKTTLDWHGFWLATTSDAWYRANGKTEVRGIQPDARRYAGSEVDLTMNVKVNSHLDVLLGYSHFFPGSYLADTGAADDANFAYVMVTLNF